MPGVGSIPPVAWERPGDEQMFWQQDKMHFPNQLSMMEDAFIKLLYAEGFVGAAVRP